MSEEPKQIIIVRTDLRNTQGQKIHTGKIIAQCCHASMGSILNYMRIDQQGHRILDIDHAATVEWLDGRFKKICLKVSGEQELLEIYRKALDNNVNVKLIEDAGLTEFGNVPTLTALALGPDYSSNLDHLVSHLSLY